MSMWALLQRCLPQHSISRMTGALAASESRTLKNFLIRRFVSWYRIDLTECSIKDPADYGSFNAFFTRALEPGARPIDDSKGAIVSPVDGRISQIGTLDGDRVIQAKGRDYSVDALLGASGNAFAGGHFVTIYLAPYNYHRIHMPIDGRLTSMTAIPGRLFSVSDRTAGSVDALFARNERAVCRFEARTGEMSVVLVGALNVGSVDTVWRESVMPVTSGDVHTFRYDDPPIVLKRGEELGRFNLGSTVILLFPPGRIDWLPGLASGDAVKMGERIGQRVLTEETVSQSSNDAR